MNIKQCEKTFLICGQCRHPLSAQSFSDAVRDDQEEDWVEYFSPSFLGAEAVLSILVTMVGKYNCKSIGKGSHVDQKRGHISIHVNYPFTSMLVSGVEVHERQQRFGRAVA